LDRVEVARQQRAREDRSCLVAELSGRVPRREVVERERGYLGLTGERGGLARGGVTGLGGAVVLLLGDRGLVDEYVGPVGGGARPAPRIGPASSSFSPGGPWRASVRSSARRSNVLSRPGRPSQWSAW